MTTYLKNVKDFYPTETKIQQGIIKWAKMQSCAQPELKLLYAIPNGANVPIVNRKRLVAEGMKKGIPDLCLPIPRRDYGALYIEVKTQKGNLSKDQKEMINLLEQNGNCVIVVRTVFQAVDGIMSYLNPV